MRDFNTLGALVVCILLGSGLAMDCFDPSVDPDQGVDREFGSSLGDPIPLDPVSCQAACCAQADCDVAVVGFPADGESQCELWKCPTGEPDRDACIFKPNSQFKVYRKKEGAELHVEPLENRANFACRLPKQVGMCRAAFPRFFYNVTEEKCRKFVYGGCSGNDNNFNTEEECEATCTGVTGSPLPVDSTPPPERSVKSVRMIPANKMEHCGAEPEVGPCKASFQRWYFNRQTGSCQTFTYGGCLGNHNNYISEESCMSTCSASSPASSEKSQYEEECRSTPDPGRCRGAFPMFYFNHNSATCQHFLYGGCGGNKNRFDTEDECLRRCSPDGSFDTREKTRHRWTSAFFLFITLAAVSALLLVTLVLVSLRRHRLSRRASLSDKEELLPDDQSSVDSLPLSEEAEPQKDRA